MEKTETVEISTGYDIDDRRPFIVLSSDGGGDSEDRWKLALGVEDAQMIALNILEGVEAAKTDEFIIDVFTKNFNFSLEETAMFLREFRNHRAEKISNLSPIRSEQK